MFFAITQLLIEDLFPVPLHLLSPFLPVHLLFGLGSIIVLSIVILSGKSCHFSILSPLFNLAMPSFSWQALNRKDYFRRHKMPEVGANFNVIPALLPRRPSLCYNSHCDNGLCASQSCCPTEAVSQTPAPPRRLLLVS